jgi:ABC-type iron transport system FetAB ATPase subunit
MSPGVMSPAAGSTAAVSPAAAAPAAMSATNAAATVSPGAPSRAADGAAGPDGRPAAARSADTPRLRLVGLHSALAGPFDLAVPAGTCVAIAGPSGSGKSLLLRMIADLDPSAGDVFLDGQERRSLAAPAWRRRVVYSAAEPGWWHETVAPHFPSGAARDRALALLPRLGLAAALFDSPVVRLSTGERQRLALIRALVLQPPVLLLDEPTGPLDQDNTALVEAVLRDRLAAGTTILLVSHSPAQAERLGQQQFRMQDRRLVPA